MILPGLRKPPSLIIILCLIGALALTAAPAAQHSPGGGVYAFQDPGYPTPGEQTPAYPVDTPSDEPTLIIISNTPAPTLTPTSTATLAPDLRLTEDAEVGDSQSTPAASATPGPSITPVFTQTETVTITVTPMPAGAAGGWMDWGFFALGFALPLLAGCGFVLYWLDRRPGLFSR